jgi:hypothetical protein
MSQQLPAPTWQEAPLLGLIHTPDEAHELVHGVAVLQRTQGGSSSSAAYGQTGAAPSTMPAALCVCNAAMQWQVQVAVSCAIY